MGARRCAQSVFPERPNGDNHCVDLTDHRCPSNHRGSNAGADDRSAPGWTSSNNDWNSISNRDRTDCSNGKPDVTDADNDSHSAPRVPGSPDHRVLYCKPANDHGRSIHFVELGPSLERDQRDDRSGNRRSADPRYAVAPTEYNHNLHAVCNRLWRNRDEPSACGGESCADPYEHSAPTHPPICLGFHALHQSKYLHLGQRGNIRCGASLWRVLDRDRLRDAIQNRGSILDADFVQPESRSTNLESPQRDNPDLPSLISAGKWTDRLFAGTSDSQWCHCISGQSGSDEYGTRRSVGRQLGHRHNDAAARQQHAQVGFFEWRNYALLAQVISDFLVSFFLSSPL